MDDSVLLTAASLHDRKVAAGSVRELVSALADAMERQIQELKHAVEQVDAVTTVVLGDES